MNGKNSSLKVVLLLLALWLQIGPLSACSLALHDWRLVFYLKIPVASPIFPLAELNIVSLRIKENPVSAVIWMAKHDLLSQLALSMLKTVADQAATIPWAAVSNGDSLLGKARESKKSGPGTMLVGSDKCSIKIAFFSDRNSGFNCHQLVIMQSNRIRAVQPDAKVPWAQESVGQSWLSLIFYQIPVPGRILSLSTYPVRQTRKSIAEDHPLVENLLNSKLLLRRPDLVVDPYVFDFPELPE